MDRSIASTEAYLAPPRKERNEFAVRATVDSMGEEEQEGAYETQQESQIDNDQANAASEQQTNAESTSGGKKAQLKLRVDYASSLVKWFEKDKKGEQKKPSVAIAITLPAGKDEDDESSVQMDSGLVEPDDNDCYHFTAIETDVDLTPGAQLMQSLVSQPLHVVMQLPQQQSKKSPSSQQQASRTKVASFSADLLPLAFGERVCTAALDARQHEVQAGMLPDEAKLSVTAELSGSPSNDDDMGSGNVLELVPEYVQNLPDFSQFAQQVSFTAAADIHGKVFAFENGALCDSDVPAAAEQQRQPKRSSKTNKLSGDTANEEASQSELKSQEQPQRELRWSDATWQRQFLTAEENRGLKTALKRNETFVAEISRHLKPDVKGFDANFHKFLARGSLSLQSLLDPGETDATIECALAYVNESTEPLVQRQERSGKPIQEQAPEKSPLHGCTIVFRTRVMRALLPEFRPPKAPALTLEELLPSIGQRRGVTKDDADQREQSAAEEFRNQARNAAKDIALECYRLNGVDNTDFSNASQRKELAYVLNQNGKFKALKDKLQAAASKLINERFSSHGDQESIIHAVYAELMEEMHRALNEPEQSEADDVDACNVEKLGKLAEEYSTTEQLSLARMRYKQHIDASGCDAASWLAFARFLMRTKDRGKAEEALKEAASQREHSSHGNALLILALYTIEINETERAEAFAKQATDALPTMPETWATLALVYKCQQSRVADDLEGDIDLAEKRASDLVANEEEGGEVNVGGANRLYMRIAYIALDAGVPHAALYALTFEQSNILRTGKGDDGMEVSNDEQLLRMYARLAYEVGEYECCIDRTKRCMELSVSDPELYEMSADCYYMLGQSENASKYYARALGASQGDRAPALFCRYSRILLQHNSVHAAAGVSVQACKQHPDRCSVWHSAGKALLTAGYPQQAEEAFAQANAIDYYHPGVWADLALACLHLQRPQEARECTRLALKHELETSEQFAQIGKQFASIGFFSDAHRALYRAMSLAEPDVPAWIFHELQHVHQALGEYDKAAQIAERIQTSHRKTEPGGTNQ